MDDPKIVLVAETGSDIPAEVAERLNIHIVPMHVSFGETSKDDGTFPSEEICSYYNRTGKLPKTSGCTPEDFSRVFASIHLRWPEAQILYLAYSAATTVSYQSAHIAAENRDYITCLDTKAVSAGQYAIVVRMAQLLAQHPEWGIEDAVSGAEDLIARSKMCFAPDDIDYLRAGGRVSNTAALCGKILNIHPLIEIVNGYVVASRKLRGSAARLAPKLIETYTMEKNLERDEIWLIYSPGLSEDVKARMEQAAQSCGFQTITWVKTGGVITTHGGPGAFGLAGFSANKQIGENKS